MNSNNTSQTPISSIRATLARRLAAEDGVSMLAAIMALVVGMSMAAAAFATASSETTSARTDRWQRVAFQTAQTGVSDYVNQLANDPNSWSVCDRARVPSGDGLGLTAVNDTVYGSAYTALYGNANTHPTRRWLPWQTRASAEDFALENQYTIDLIPANGQPYCGTVNEALAAERMVSNVTGTFRVRVTGRAGPPAPTPPASWTGTATAWIDDWRAKKWKRSSIVSEFRRAGFLDYVYFTDHEALDPVFIRNINQTLIGGLVAIFNPPNFDNCDNYYRYTNATDSGREGVEAAGWVCPNDRPVYNGEEISGPAHTNDSISVQSSGGSAPKFGNANMGDKVEVYDNGRSGSTCTSAQRTGGCACPFRITQSFAGTGIATGRTCVTTANQQNLIKAGVQLITGPDAGHIQMPEGNTELIQWAGDPAPVGHLYEGRTRIVLRNDGKYDVTNYDNNGAVIASTSRTGVDYPADGVIYAKNRTGASSCEADTDKMYTDPNEPAGMGKGCALLEVSGTYNKSLTIGSQADIVILGNIQRASGTNALLGLVATNYVRIRHYSTGAGDFNYYKKCVTPPIPFWFIVWWYIPDVGAHAECMKSGSSGQSFISTLVTLLQSNPFDSAPLTGYTCDRESSPTNPGAVMRVDAAILALKRSFTVDSSNCGNQIGDASNPLVINGAMTQNWRGGITGKDWSHIFDPMCNGEGRPTDFFGGIWYDIQRWFVQTLMGWCNNNHGYLTKQFNYDYLLRALSPPHFLKPNESAWRINRVRQTVPACECGPTG